LVNQVVQREESGRVPQVGQTGRSAVLKEKFFTRSSSKSFGAHGKAVVARPSVYGWCRTRRGTKEATDKEKSN
jgi:hypothetical protein